MNELLEFVLRKCYKYTKEGKVANYIPELAKANIPVTILERGPYIKSKDSFEYYDMKYYDKRLKNTNSVDLLKTTCIGGSTIVAAGIVNVPSFVAIRV